MNFWQVVSRFILKQRIFILIVLAVLVLFGGRKIPELMKGLGKGMKEFKNATKEDGDVKEKSDTDKIES